MACTRFLPVLLLALVSQSLSQAIDPFNQFFNADGESVTESPVFNPKEVEAKIAENIESVPNVEKSLEEPTEVQDKFAENNKSVPNVVEKSLETPTKVDENAFKEPTEVIEKALEEPTEVAEKALENPTEHVKEAIGDVTPDEVESIIKELPSWTAPKFKEAADKITKTIEEELTKVATSLMKENDKRTKRDLFDQMTASSNDIDYTFGENEVDVDFDFLENKPVETNTARPPANPMNSQRYYYHTSTPQTTPEYYRYMPVAPVYKAEVPQETMTQRTNQASLPQTPVTTTQAPTTPQYYQTQSIQTPQYYQDPTTQATTTPAAVSEKQLPFYQQYPQEYFASSATTTHPAAAQGQESLVEEMTDNTESQIVEKEGMPKITHTSRTSTYKVSQSYPHESTYKQPQQLHYYFMLQ